MTKGTILNNKIFYMLIRTCCRKRVNNFLFSLDALAFMLKHCAPPEGSVRLLATRKSDTVIKAGSDPVEINGLVL